MKLRNRTESLFSNFVFACLCLALATSGFSQNQLNDQLRPNDQRLPTAPILNPDPPKSPVLSGALVLGDEQGFTRIFNGHDLSGWDGNPKFWSVSDGAIVGQTTAENPTKGNTFLIWTNGTTEDFELRLSYKITANNDKGFANSGVQYRSKVLDPANWVVGGYQADFEAGNTYSGILYEERMRGILAERGQKVIVKETDGKTVKDVVGSVGNSAEIQAAIKKDGWNDYVIIAQGNHLQHFINGRLTVDVTDEVEAKAAKSGVLALQLHAGQPMTVQFKQIRIKKL